VWTWSDGWREALTDDLDKVTCKRCIYLLTRWGYIVERQLFLPGMSTIIPVKET
jgi:hypothetical protein